MTRRQARWPVAIWRQHSLGLLVLLAIAALVLGFIGYLQGHASVVNAAYGTLSLLAFSYQKPPGQLHVTLQIARFMVPAVAAFATFNALTAVLEDQWHLVRARRRRGHFVVCGLGRRGVQLVRSLRGEDAAKRVIAVEVHRSSPGVELARRLGAIVVIGDSTDVDVLRAVKVKRAATLVSLLAEDAQNAAVASAAAEVCRGRSGTLDAYFHIADMDLVEDLTSVAIGSSGPQINPDWFSVPERAARLLLSQHAEFGKRAPDGVPPHLAVVGTDDLARAIIVNAARQWRAVAGGVDRAGSPGSEPPAQLRITVAAEGAQDWLNRLVYRHPSVGRIAELRPYEHDLRAAARIDDARRALADATVLFVCGSSDSESLELGFAAARTLTDTTVVVKLAIENAGFADLLDEGGPGGQIRLFSVIDETCSAEMITDGFTETLARALHSVYVGRDTGTEASVPWERLEETYREANRAQARHIKLKLQKAHCGVRPLTDWDKPLLELDADEVEDLAKLEHSRWSQERKDEGWVKGPTRSDERKVHPLIDAPWEKLPAEDAEHDRAFIRAMPRLLAAAGYETYRLGSDGGRPPRTIPHPRLDR